MGIIVSVVVSVALCIRESASMRIRILGRVPGTSFFEPLDDDEGDDPSEEIPGVLIVRLRDVSLTFGELSFSPALASQTLTLRLANAGAMKERLRRLERYGKGRHHPSDRPRRAEASVVIFHLADVEGELHFTPCATTLLTSWDRQISTPRRCSSSWRSSNLTSHGTFW